MSIIFFSQPHLLLLTIGALALNVVTVIFRNKGISRLLVPVTIFLHAVLIYSSLLEGGSYEEALALVLVSAAIAIVGCERPQANKEERGEDK